MRSCDDVWAGYRGVSCSLNSVSKCFIISTVLGVFFMEF